MGTRPSAITWEEGPARLRCGPSSGHARTPNTTHRLDLFTVQFTAIRDHGVDSISQAGSLHVCVLDKHEVLQGDSRACREAVARVHRGPSVWGVSAPFPSPSCTLSEAKYQR